MGFVCCFVLANMKSRDGAVGKATDYRRDDRGFGVRVLVESSVVKSPYGPDRL
jgi:hypothetical protein